MDKWDELRQIITYLHDNNRDKPDVVEAMRFLLNLMDIIQTKRMTAVDVTTALELCDGNETGKPCSRCPYRDTRWDGYSGLKNDALGLLRSSCKEGTL